MSASKPAMRKAQPFEIPRELERLMTPIGAVRPYEGNARRGDIEAIKASIRANGLYRAPVARKETGEVLVNNHTMIAAVELGATAMPIDWRSIPDDDRARDILLVDNRTSDLATYDDQALAKLLEASSTLDGTGYDEDAFAGVLNRAGPLPSTPDPEPAEPPDQPRSKRGQVYKLGPHRLLCGDARNPRHHTKLLAGETADMIWTDPPYGVDLGPLAAERGRDHGDMVGDTIDDAELEELLTEAIGNAREHLRPGGAYYLCHAATPAETVYRALRAIGLAPRQQLAWIKDRMVLGRQHYQWRHEPIAYGWRPGAAAHWYGHFDKTTVVDHATRSALEALEHADLVEIAWRLLEGEPGTALRFDRPRAAELHPTVKPAGLIAEHIRNSSTADGIVLDPFAGSGSTMIAAQTTGRRAYMMEIDPGYTDVIRDRWKDLQTLTRQGEEAPPPSTEEEK